MCSSGSAAGGRRSDAGAATCPFGCYGRKGAFREHLLKSQSVEFSSGLSPGSANKSLAHENG